VLCGYDEGAGRARVDRTPHWAPLGKRAATSVVEGLLRAMQAHGCFQRSQRLLALGLDAVFSPSFNHTR
jgi:hypothetical protein